jgi:hypothetical protein
MLGAASINLIAALCLLLGAVLTSSALHSSSSLRLPGIAASSSVCTAAAAAGSSSSTLVYQGQISGSEQCQHLEQHYCCEQLTAHTRDTGNLNLLRQLRKACWSESGVQQLSQPGVCSSTP